MQGKRCSNWISIESSHVTPYTFHIFLAFVGLSCGHSQHHKSHFDTQVGQAASPSRREIQEASSSSSCCCRMLSLFLLNTCYERVSDIVTHKLAINHEIKNKSTNRGYSSNLYWNHLEPEGNREYHINTSSFKGGQSQGNGFCCRLHV